MYSNYHTHTYRCNHAKGYEREYIENAIKSGIKNLGFSDHAPILFDGGYYSHFRMKPHIAEEYVSTLSSLKKEYEKDVNIYIGYELEYYPKYFERTVDFLNSLGCDYFIMGQHFINSEIDGIYVGAPFSDERYLSRYVEQVCEGLSSGLFTYLAHPDLPGFTGDENVYRREMVRLCEFLKDSGIPAEINFLGIQEKRRYPNEKFWEIAGEIGCSAIFGVDAHAPEELIRPEVLGAAQNIAEKNGISVLEEIKFNSTLIRRG